MLKHTSTPWALSAKDGTVFCIYGEGTTLAYVKVCVDKEQVSPATFRAMLEEGEANAKHIIHCVNNYDAMLAACMQAQLYASVLGHKLTEVEAALNAVQKGE